MDWATGVRATDTRIERQRLGVPCLHDPGATAANAQHTCVHRLPAKGLRVCHRCGSASKAASDRLAAPRDRHPALFAPAGRPRLSTGSGTGRAARSPSGFVRGAAGRPAGGILPGHPAGASCGGILRGHSAGASCRGHPARVSCRGASCRGILPGHPAGAFCGGILPGASFRGVSCRGRPAAGGILPGAWCSGWHARQTLALLRSER